MADLLYVGKSTNRKLALFGIKTIGDLAREDEDVLNSHLGKMGSILWSFANGYDDSPVKLENTHAPIKSVGNSTTTPKDLVCDEDVKIVLYILAESVAARLRENGFRCRVVEISVRDNELFSFTRQKKIDHATNITGDIAAYAYQIFKENYNWSKPIRSVGVRGADLVTDNYWEQIDLFSCVEKREKQMKMDSAVDEIRRRFGFYSIQRGLMYRDRILSAVNRAIKRIVDTHNSEKEVAAKKEKREPVMIPRFSCHIFRHKFASRFCENETNIKVIQEVMGHADVSTTMNIYAEANPDVTKSVIEKLSKNMDIF